MARFAAPAALGRFLPEQFRGRVLDPAYNDLLRDYLTARRHRRPSTRAWLRASYEWRALAMVLDCGRLWFADRVGSDPLPAGDAPPPNRVPRRGSSMDSFARDLRYALRQLIKSPAFTATAVLIVALGIGANTAAFSVVNAMLLRPQPFERPDELVDIYQDSDDGEPNSTSFPAYRDIAAHDDLFSGVAATFSSSASLQRDEGMAQAIVEFSTSNYLEVLGLRPSIGRWFEAIEDQPGGEPVAVLTHRAWLAKFGADPGILGETVRLNGSPITVVGVGPEGFTGFLPLSAIDMWLSLSSLGPLHGDYAAATLEQRGDHWFFAKARLREGVTAQQAQEAMSGLADRLAAEYPEHNSGRGITVFAPGDVRMHPSVDAMLSPTAAFLMTVVGLVLLIACSNLANLLLARASARGREMSIRVALGANRRQVVRQLLTESVLLALAGGALGLLIASWLVRILMTLDLPLPTPMAVDLSLDVRVLGFAAGLSILTGIAFGLAPAIKASRPDLASTMRDDTVSAAWRQRRFGLRNGLVVLQVAMSFVLLVAAGLFIRSLNNAQQIDTGFAVDDVAYLQTNPGHAGYSSDDAHNILDDLLVRARALPGVEAAGLGVALPVTPRGTTTLVMEGYEPPTGTLGVEVPFNVVDTGYFETLRVPLLHGRTFTDVDRIDAERVAVISEAMAQRYWGESDAVGRRFRSEGRPDSWTRVIGVVGDTTIRDLTEDTGPQMYRPWAQSGGSAGAVFVRTAGDPSAVLGMLRDELRSIDAEIPVLRIRTMAGHLSDSLSAARVGVQFLGGFGFLALVLASLGLYGIVSFAVGRRTLEVGVRMALGAQAGQVVWLVLREVLVVVSVGVVLGLALSVAATAGLGGLLFDVAPTDPLTLAVVAVVLFVVALGAAMLPALKAAKADPVLALRQS